MFAWHFLNGNKLRTSEEAPKDGVPLEYTGKVVICRSGLHASENIVDALSYARGLTLCRVRCAKVIEKQKDKFVCRKRTILWRIDEVVMRRVLIWWAYWCVERAKQCAASTGAADAAHVATAASARAAAARRAAAYKQERKAQETKLLRLIEIAHKGQSK